VSIKVKGEKALAASLEKFNINTQMAVDTAVRITAFKVLENAVRSIQTESKGQRHGNHVSSRKGDAPNTDTGRLVSSINVLHERGKRVAFVGTAVDYGYILEKKMDRPWLEPSLKSQEGKLMKRLIKAMKKQADKASR
jgi:hypothetical protein